MVIQHNMSAFNAQRMYNLINTGQSKSAEKLSSGYKINRAADDAAGLAISEKMRKQVRALNRASDNIEDGVSFTQVADGALNEVTEIMQRLNTLSIQAANGTLSAGDRIAINNEITQLKHEMTRVFTTTTFNSQPIWGGTASSSRTEGLAPVVGLRFGDIEVGSKITDACKFAVPSSDITLELNNEGNAYRATWTGFGITTPATQDPKTAKTYYSDWIPLEDGKLQGSYDFDLSKHCENNPAELKDLTMKFSFQINDRASDFEAKKLFDSISISTGTPYRFEINTGSSNVTGHADIDYQYQLNYGRKFDNTDESKDFIQELASSAGVSKPTSVDDTSKELSFTMKIDGIAMAAVPNYAYYSSGPDHFDDTPNPVTHLRPGENVWWHELKDSQGNPYPSRYSRDTGFTLASQNDAIVSGSNYSYYKSTTTMGADSTPIATITANNPKPNTSTYSLYYKLQPANAGGTSIGSLSFSYSITDAGSADASKEALYNRINSITTMDIKGVTNHSWYNTGLSGDTSTTVGGSLKEFLSYDVHRVNIHSGAEDTDKIHLEYPDLSLQSLGLSDLNTLTEDAANAAIDQVSAALERITQSRSLFGAFQNRLVHAVNIDDNSSENTSAAESRIRDTDMAKEMVNYSKSSLLSQVGQSMMSQANSSTQSVLSLLQK